MKVIIGITDNDRIDESDLHLHVSHFYITNHTKTLNISKRQTT